MEKVYYKCLAIIFLLSLNSYSQSDFKQGKIVKTNDEEVSGYINYLADENLATYCEFKESLNHESQMFSPEKLKSFEFIGGRKFVSKEYKGEYFFSEFILNGVINLYSYKKGPKFQFFVEKEDSEFIFLDNSEVKVEKDGKTYNKRKEIYKGYLLSLTKDYPDLKKDIFKLQSLNQKNLINLTQKYHNFVCDTVACEIYTKPKVSSKFFPEVGYSTGTYVFNEKNISNKTFFGNIYYLLPISNERFFLKSGFSLEKNSFNSSSEELIKIPFQFYYLPFVKRINPVFGMGIAYNNNKVSTDLYDDISFSILTDFGINLKITNRFSLKTTISLEKPIKVENSTTITKNRKVNFGIIYNY